MTTDRDVFISYHTSTAKDIVIQIGEALESKGVTCWYAPRDCDGNFDEAIMHALNRAPIFLLIINEGSMKSQHVKNEINAAFNRYAEKMMAPVIFQVSDCPVNDTVQYFFGRVHRFNGMTPPLSDRIDELVNRIINIKNNLKVNVFTDGEMRIVSSTLTPSSYFVGRKREQLEILEFLQRNQKIFVSGMGGIGKSQLMRQFAVNYKEQFRTISWATYTSNLKDLIVSDSNVKISNFFKLSDDEDSDSYYRRKLDFLKNHSTDEDLIIVDNFDKTDDSYLDDVMALPCKIVFTTRIARSENCYRLGKIDNADELLELFCKGYPRTLDEENKKIVREIIQLVDGHTLAIRMISTLMRDRRIRPAEMRDHLKNGEFDILDSVTKDKTDHIITNMFKLANLTDNQKAILYNLAFVPVSGLEAVDFFDMCELDDYSTLDELIDKNWILHNSATDYVSLHPIIQNLCLAQIPFDDDTVRCFVEHLNKMMVECKFYDFEKRSWLYLVGKKMQSVMPSTSALYEAFVLSAVEMYHYFSYHNSIIKLLSTFVQQDVSNTSKLIAYMKAATSFRCIEDYEGLFDFATKAQNILPQTDLSERDKAKQQSEIYSLFGWYYWLTKDFEKSLEFFNKKLALDLERFSDEKHELGWAYFNVGMILADMQRYDESMHHFQRAIECFDTLNFDFGKACCYNSMAFACIHQGKYEQALEYGNVATEYLVRTVGEKQADTAHAYRALMMAHKALGHDAVAKEYREKSEKILEELGMTKILQRWRSEN